MKKLTLLLATSLVCLFVFTGCNKDSGSPIDPPISNDSITAVNYLEEMSPKQVERGAALVAVKTIGNLVFLQYEVGEIKNCYIQNAMSPLYQDGSLKKLNYTESYITSSTISNGLSNAISQTNSVSISDSTDNTLSWRFGASNSATTSAKIGVNVGIVSAEAGISDTFTVSAEIGSSYTEHHQEEIAKATAETVNKSYSTTFLEESCKTVVSEYDMSLYESGYYYALAVLANIKIYQIISYDMDAEEFYTSYFVTDLQNSYIKMISSQDGDFSVTPEKQLYPITEISMTDILDNTDLNASGDYINFMGGNGTAEKPYRISSARHFSNIKLYPNAYYVLVSDIDMSEIAYFPPSTFSGNLNGANYTIKNLSIKEESANLKVRVGLFKSNSGTISNLNVKNSQFVASPRFNNENVEVYSGAIAAINNGIISNCHVNDTIIIANSNDLAEKFQREYKEDPRDIIRGSKNWKAWISQSFDAGTANWSDDLLMRVYAGGISGENNGEIKACSFIGYIEANLYNMLVQSKSIEQICFAGGIAGYNTGYVEQTTTNANIKAWIELDNDARGMGWVGDTYPKGTCHACGLVGKNTGTVTGQAHGEQKVGYRIYVPQYVFLSGAGYNTSTKGHTDNLTISDSSTYF